MKSFDYILGVHPLYSPIQLEDGDREELDSLIGKHFRIDCYCPSCKQNRTFTTHRIGEKSEAFREESLAIMTVREHARRVAKLPPPAPTVRDGARAAVEQRTDQLLAQSRTDFVVTMYCTRKSYHIAKFYFRIELSTLMKIGQIPSLADIGSGEVRRYAKVLGEERSRELSRAIRLAANGVGIGSYVYLRRIFESLIEDHRRAGEETGKDLSRWNDMRMGERITELRDTLPDFLVKNRSLHGLLSEGIHSLSEEECLKNFPVLNQSILLILQQDHERREREQTEKNLAAELGRLTNKG